MQISPSIALKVGIGLAGTTAISTGAYLAYDRLSKENISELIKKEDLTLLAAEDKGAEWLKRWKEYVAGDNNVWNLEGYDKKTPSESDIPQSFKDTCNNKSAERVSDINSDTYKQVSKFCTKSFSISSLIGKETKVTLINKDKGDAKWNEAWKKYIENDNNELEIDKWPEVKKTADKAPDDYKTKCDNKKTTEVKNTKDPAYLTVKKWCTEPKVA